MRGEPIDPLEPGSPPLAPEPSGGAAMRHFGALVTGETANKVLRFAAAAILARGLSADDYGLFNVGIAVSGLIVVATMLGLPDVAARDIARERSRASWIAGRVIAARVTAAAAVCAVGMVIVAQVWPEGVGYSFAIVAIVLAMSASAEWLGRGLEKMGRVGLGTGTGGLVALAGAAVVAAASGSAAAGLLAFAVAELAAAAVYLSAGSATGMPRLGLAGVRPMLGRSWPIALSALAVYAYYANVDTIILAATRSTDEAGLYSAAYRLFLAFNVVATFAAYATFPRLAREVGESSARQVVDAMARPLAALACYSTAILGVALLAGEPLLELMFGTRFGVSADALVVLCVSCAWYGVGYPIGYALIAADRNRRFMAGALTGGLLTLALDAVLIPPYGMVGAAAATAISIVIATFVWLGRERHSDAVRLVLPALAVASAAGVLGLVHQQAATLVGVALITAAAVGGVALVTRGAST